MHANQAGFVKVREAQQRKACCWTITTLHSTTKRPLCPLATRVWPCLGLSGCRTETLDCKTETSDCRTEMSDCMMETLDCML